MKRLDILSRAQAHWQALADFRLERARCKRYTYGRQWDDPITVNNQLIKEEDFIRSQGNIPLKNNLIRRIVRNVLGVFRNRYETPTIESLHLPDNPQSQHAVDFLNQTGERNRIEELFSRTMEEFLISGLAVHRKWYGYRDGVAGCWTDYVQPDYFFVDADMRDFRGWDTSIVGEIHDVDFGELCCRLCGDRADIERLRSIYTEAASKEAMSSVAGSCSRDSSFVQFLTPNAPGRCRVIEVWVRSPQAYLRCHDTRDGTLFRLPAESGESEVEAENELRRKEWSARGLNPEDAPLILTRWLMEEKWHYYFLSPLGDVLAEGDSPYAHGSHPYVFKAYPFIDGEIHSFVADLIDQQRYINRLVTLYDWIMKASAKGVLLFPEDALPDGVEIDDISSEWSRFNGVILFRPKPGIPLPQQISGNAANIGITELLNVQLKMMEDVSGVNSALQGKLDSGAVSGTLYTQQTRHALTGLLDILDSFDAFIAESHRKDLANLFPPSGS